MDDLAEKRVYASGDAANQLVVAASPGLVTVKVADGRVGEFGVARRCAPTDVAVAPHADGAAGRLAVATDEDVLLARARDLATLRTTGFGPATALSFHGRRLIAGGSGGTLGVYNDGEWRIVDQLSPAATTVAGGLVGSPAGVFRLGDGRLRPAGLQGVNDLALAAGVPLAATETGLYELGNGWLEVLAGDVELVSGAADGRAHAATAGAFYERVDGAWTAVDGLPREPVVAVAYGGPTYALNVAGDLLVEEADGWHQHPLGIAGVVAGVVR